MYEALSFLRGNTIDLKVVQRVLCKKQGACDIHTLTSPDTPLKEAQKSR
jgi:hypothetical protein